MFENSQNVKRRFEGPDLDDWKMERMIYESCK
jgi:hypothetical protein